MKRCFSRYGICAACITLRELEAHHIVPQRYEKATNNSPMCHLCHSCHLDLHKNWIDPLARPTREVFIEMTLQFLYEKHHPA